MPSPLLSATLAVLGVVGLSGCGESGGRGAEAGLLAPSTRSAPRAGPSQRQLAAAGSPVRRSFPAARGRSLAELTSVEHVRDAGRLAMVTSTYVPGTGRVAFGMLNAAGAFVYGPTALYVAAAPGAPARGPYVAPADSLRVPAEFRSVADKVAGEPHAIYHAEVPFPRAATYHLLALTRSSGGTLAAFGRVTVTAGSDIPDVGQPAPAVATATTASVGGDVDQLTTRKPPEAMHSVSFQSVLGRRPVALLFSTPAFCRSRMCGPVTDIVVFLQHQLGKRVVFLHSEVYRDNNPMGSVRAALLAFHVNSEPWLFTVDRRGRIAARLEGAFGVEEARAAVRAALR